MLLNYYICTVNKTPISLDSVVSRALARLENQADESEDVDDPLPPIAPFSSPPRSTPPKETRSNTTVDDSLYINSNMNQVKYGPKFCSFAKLLS